MPFCPTCNGRFQEGTFCPKDGTQLLPDGEQPQSLVGQIVGGRYRLTQLLGAGGMGEVYAAQHIHIHKKVAVKLLHPEINTNPEALERFRREANSASSIGHDNIVGIDDFGQMDDGRVYLCMEFLEGHSLADAMQVPGGMDPVQALDLMIQVCDGLAAAHAKGIIHRDMKPENVFLTRRSDGTEVAKILDFGIAKVSGTDENQSLTKTGTVFGTPHYMSPEQALGQKLDHRADIYSVGVMLFEIFTGQVPFKAESFMGILSQHITKQPPTPSTMTPGRTIPQPIEELILKAMAKEPGKRFASVKEMGAVLHQLRDSIAPAAKGQPRAATLAFGSGSSPAPQAGPGPGHPGMLATVPDGPGVPGFVPGPGVGTQPTVAAIDTGQGPAAAAAPAPQTFRTGPGPAATPTPIPKTVMAGTDQQVAPAAVAPSVPVVPSNYGVAPPPARSHTGLIVGLVVGGLLLLGGGGAAAWYFLIYDKGPGPDDTVVAAGTDSGTAGAGGTQVAVAGGTEPKVEPKPRTEPRVEPKPRTEPRVEPKPRTEPRVEPRTEPRVEPKTEPKTEPKPRTEPEPRTEPKPEPKPKPKPEPPKPKKTHYEVKLVTVPTGARVRLNGKKTLGYTPLVLKLKPGQSMRLLLARGGRTDKWVTVTGSADGTKTFRLAKRRFGGPPDGIPGGDPGGMPGADPFK